MCDGSSDGRAEGDTPGVNDKGLVTGDRKVRKDAYYFYKANWNPEPMVYLTDRRFTERTNPVTDLKAYTTLTTVTMLVNGRVVITVRTDVVHCAVWPAAPLAAGCNIVQVV